MWEKEWRERVWESVEESVGVRVCGRVRACERVRGREIVGESVCGRERESLGESVGERACGRDRVWE